MKNVLFHSFVASFIYVTRDSDCQYKQDWLFWKRKVKKMPFENFIEFLL